MHKEKYDPIVNSNYIKDPKLLPLGHCSTISVLIKSNTPSLHYSNTPAISKEHLQTVPVHPSAVAVAFQYDCNGVNHAQI